MAFSTVMGIAQLGSSLFGAMGANRRANQQYMLQMEQLRNQREQQEMQFSLARDAERRQQEENAYLREIEQMNRSIQQQERLFQMQEMEEYKNQVLAERRREIDRQIQADKEAARIQEFRLNQLLQNQDLRQEERDFAIEQLRNAQSIASGERDEEMRRFLEDRETAKIEREFLLEEYQGAQQRAKEEQAIDLALRDRIMGRTDSLRQTLQAAQAELGDVPEIERLTAGDIDAEIRRRQEAYMSDVDRAADRVASVNEADLMRAGLDRSTTGTARRGEVASRLAQEYQNARQRAYDDALRYISGEQDALTSNLNAIIGRRGAVLEETAGVEGTGIDTMLNLPGYASTVDTTRLASLVPSSILARDISSANNYRSPVAVSSALYDGMGAMTPGIDAGFRVGSSAAVNPQFAQGLQTGVYTPARQYLPDPSGYYTQAFQTGDNLLRTSTNMYSNAAERSRQASAGFGSSLAGFLNDNADTIDGWFGGGTPGMTQAPAVNPMDGMSGSQLLPPGYR